MESLNFIEWGIKCDALETTSTQVKDVTPIVSIAFKWGTVLPDTVPQFYDVTRKTYGIGTCEFKILHSSIKAKLQTAFQKQTVLPTIEFVRFANENGILAEQERYSYNDVIITGYECAFDIHNVEVNTVQIMSKSGCKYVQIVRENGKVVGQFVSEPGGVLIR